MNDSRTFAPVERLGLLAARVIPDIETAIEDLVGEDGPWTKGRADTLNSLNRLLASFLEFSRSAAEKKRLAEENEQDVSAILAAIDQRIVELARTFAARLGCEDALPSAGREDCPRMGDDRAGRPIPPLSRQG